MKARLPFHYAWVMVATVAVIGAVSAAVRFSFAVFIDPLHMQFGWSHAHISGSWSISFIAMGLSAIAAGWLSDRFGIRKVLLAALALFLVGMLLTGYVRSLWQLYLYNGVLVGASMSLFQTPTVNALTYWFRKRIGVAVGIAMAAQGIGPVAMVPLTRYWLTSLGWQETFLILGVGGGVILLAASLLVQATPASMGLTAYGEGAASTAGPAITLDEDVTRRAAHQRNFWLLILIHLLGCVGHSIPLVYVVSMATFVGVSGVVAAGVLSVLTAVSIASRFGMSVLADSAGGKWSLALALLVQSTSIFLLFGATHTSTFYLFAILFGIGYGGEMVAFPILNRQYYGKAPTGAIYGFQIMGASVGMALGGWLGGVLFDATGAYTWTIIAAIATGYLGLIATLSLAGRVRLPARRAAPRVEAKRAV